MKRVFPALVLSLMMIAPLAACTARPAGNGTNNSTGANNNTGNSVTDNAAGARSRMGTSGTGSNNGSSTGTGSAFSNGRYFADDSGDVRDGNHTTIGDDMRDMTDDVMDGVRRAGDTVGNAINDMTHN